MSDPKRPETEPEPQSATDEKTPIRKSQEEFIGDEAQPSKDRSEVEGSHPGSGGRQTRLR